MTDLERVRAVALLLPEVEQRDADGACAFLVDGNVFVELRDGALRVRATDLPGVEADAAAREWKSIALGDGTDWVLVEDLVARAWEMTAPRRLLEAGGR